MELRKARRFVLEAPATFCWKDVDGVFRERLGITHDICSVGVFIVSDSALPRGTQIEVDVHLSPSEEGRKTIDLQGEGKVVRLVVTEEAVIGFAAEMTFQAKPSSEDLGFDSLQ